MLFWGCGEVVLLCIVLGIVGADVPRYGCTRDKRVVCTCDVPAFAFGTSMSLLGCSTVVGGYRFVRGTGLGPYLCKDK